MPSAPPNSVSFRKNHFGLQLSLNSLNSSGAEPEPAQSLSRTGTMNALRIARRAGLACLLLLAPRAIAARPSNISLPPETPAILDKIYSFDLQGAVEAAKRMEEEQPNHPLGYLLETEAMWWRIWCTSADFKYGMSDARRRPKLEANRRKCNFMPVWLKPPSHVSTDCAARIATQRAPESVDANISCAPKLWMRISPMPTWAWVFTTITWTL